MGTVIKTQSFRKCTVDTMSDGCFSQIANYLQGFENLIGATKEETERNINNTPYFLSGCFTCIQAAAFAEYYHEK